MNKKKIKMNANIIHVINQIELGKILNEYWNYDSIIDIVSVIYLGTCSTDGMYKYQIVYKCKIEY
jgi:hypothetical protein